MAEMAQNRTASEQKLGKPLKRAFFARSVLEVAPDLIGATLLIDGVGGGWRIETRDNGKVRTIAVKREGDHTRIAVASLGAPASN